MSTPLPCLQTGQLRMDSFSQPVGLPAGGRLNPCLRPPSHRVSKHLGTACPFGCPDMPDELTSATPELNVAIKQSRSQDKTWITLST